MMRCVRKEALVYRYNKVLECCMHASSLRLPTVTCKISQTRHLSLFHHMSPLYQTQPGRAQQ